MILSATRRRTGPVSAASYTVPIPPSPSTPRTRYGPIVSGVGIGDCRLVVSVMSLTLAFAAMSDAVWSRDLLWSSYDQLGVNYETCTICSHRTRHVDLIGVILVLVGSGERGGAGCPSVGVHRRFVQRNARTSVRFAWNRVDGKKTRLAFDGIDGDGRLNLPNDRAVSVPQNVPCCLPARS